MIRTSTLAAIALIHCTACVVEDPEVEVDSTEQAIRIDHALTSPLVLDCGTVPGFHMKTWSDETSFEVTMEGGDVLWVGGNAVATYNTHDTASPYYDKALVETQVVCEPGTIPTVFPDNADVLSRSGVNQYRVTRNGATTSYLTATHLTRAVFVAPAGTEAQTYTCWMIYTCSPKDDSELTSVTFAPYSTFLTEYSVNQYPGMNFRAPESSNVLVHSTGTYTPGGGQMWDAGQSTASDTEIVALWMPRLTDCIPGDVPVSEGGSCTKSDPADCECYGADSYAEYADTFFDWRLTVHQYRGNALCNTSVGPWNNGVRITYDKHHQDVTYYSRTVPIVENGGNIASCGGDADARKFRVDAQIRKTSDSYNDITVHGGWAGATNLLVYSR